MLLGVQVQDVQGAVRARPRDGRGGAVGVVAVDPVEREYPHQVVEKAQFDLHQRAVAGVLALQLAQQALQLGAQSGARARASAWSISVRKRSSVTASAAMPSRSPLRVEQA